MCFFAKRFISKFGRIWPDLVLASVRLILIKSKDQMIITRANNARRTSTCRMSQKTYRALQKFCYTRIHFILSSAHVWERRFSQAIENSCRNMSPKRVWSLLQGWWRIGKLSRRWGKTRCMFPFAWPETDVTLPHTHLKWLKMWRYSKLDMFQNTHCYSLSVFFFNGPRLHMTSRLLCNVFMNCVHDSKVRCLLLICLNKK